jgi:uncharacterized protein DUF4381
MSTRASQACAAAALGLLATLSSAVPVSAAANAPTGNFSTANAPTGDVAAPGAPATDTATAEDIRDIRGPKGILPPWLLPALLAGVVLLAIGGYAVWRRLQRRPPPRRLEPFEIALQRLEEIRTLLDPSSVREFSIAISDIVRQYIEARFKVTATHRTTEEFLHDLLAASKSLAAQRNDTLAAHRDLLEAFLNQCDLAKFAGVSLSRQILESLHESACRFVIETSKPPPTTETRGVPPPGRDVPLSSPREIPPSARREVPPPAPPVSARPGGP